MYKLLNQRKKANEMMIATLEKVATQD